jgi:hypothetical protein
VLDISVQTRHVVLYDSPILVCVQEGDVQGVRKLFQSGEASINDVDPSVLFTYVAPTTSAADLPAIYGLLTAFYF